MPIQPVIRRVKGLPLDLFAAEGLMYHDWHAITACQRACTSRLGQDIQREQEDYMIRHPEIAAMLKIFIAKMAHIGKRRDLLMEAANHFTRPFEELDAEVRTFLESPKEGPYVDMSDRKFYEFDEIEFMGDLERITAVHYPPAPWVYHSPPPSLPNTLSSSFLSVQTSANTLPTPEPVIPPEPTTSEIFYKMISNTVDKVIYIRVDDRSLNYDTAYVELMKAVEAAMEIPVIEIRIDIAELLHKAYHMFEVNIIAKERYAAEIAWEKRMRKKLKKTLRRQKNFKGYETPPPTCSKVSSHESYKRPPPRPCQCQPLANFNRYGKDRFGIYLPRTENVAKENVTTTPDCPSETDEDEEEVKTETEEPTMNKEKEDPTKKKEDPSKKKEEPPKK